MFSFLKRNTKTVEPTFTVEKTPSGRFAIVDTVNGIVATYGRRGDAVRGASRKGITLANA